MIGLLKSIKKLRKEKFSKSHKVNCGFLVNCKRLRENYINIGGKKKK